MEQENFHDKKVVVSHQNLEAKEFWKEKLSGEHYTWGFPYTHLTTGLPGSTPVTATLQQVEITFPPSLSEKLTTACKGSDYAIHIFLSAALAILLDKYSYRSADVKNILFISPIYKQQTEGEFINTVLPITISLEGDPSFKSFLGQVKQTVLQAVHYQNYPVELLMRQMNLSSTRSTSASLSAVNSDTAGITHNDPSANETGNFLLFETALLLENIHDFKYIKHTDSRAIFSFCRTGNTVTGKLQYHHLLYHENTMKQIANHFTTVLELALADPASTLSRIDILSGSEKEELCHTFNQAVTIDYPRQTLDELFTAQAQKYPNKNAVIFVSGDASSQPEPETITYRELEDKARRLAQYLQNKGMNANPVVPIIFEPSIEMVIAILGVLKSGAAYLPIEPTDPNERILYLLADANASLLLTTRQLYDIAMKESGWDSSQFDIVLLDDVLDQSPAAGENSSSAPAKQFPLAVSTTHPGESDAALRPAYIIYTSGTTGKPKGVLVPHRGVLDYTVWRTTTYGISGDVILQLLSYSFDGSGSNFYSALLSGGTLVMIPSAQKKDYEFIKKVIKNQKINSISLVPPMYDTLLNFASPGDLDSLKCVILGGERATAQVIREANEKFPHIHHVVEYGPTETSIGAAANISISPHETAVIGSPIAHNRLFVTNTSGYLQPKAAPGELCISGPGVARGYVNNPELTAERFVICHPSFVIGKRSGIFPAAHRLGARAPYRLGACAPRACPNDQCPMTNDKLRLYRSGDLARWLPDGKVELFGRIDRQVKIRGFRIELNEIETYLRSHPGVKECIVICSKSGSEQIMELIAYYQADESLTAGLVREYLAAKLPDYMIPSRLIRLNEFPLTANGKIDHNLLAVYSEFNEDREIRLPRNFVEQRLAEVWKQVIGSDKFGIDDAFFDIGGTSITAMAVVAQLSKEFEISIDHIYTYGTIAEIAKNISWAKGNLKRKIDEIKLELSQDSSLSEETRKRREEQQQTIEYLHQDYLQLLAQEQRPLPGQQHDYERLLLTGATGFLGVHLLQQLLEYTKTQLYLLIRADSPAEAQARLDDKLRFFFGEDYPAAYRERLYVIPGDMRADKAGIEDTLYDELCQSLDAVLHAAAKVSYLGMYEDFYRSNVTATQNLLELAAAGKKKDFHYISDIGISLGNAEGKKAVLFTEFSLDSPGEKRNHYYKSKLEAEQVALNYRKKGLDVSIYRLAPLSFNSVTGKFHENMANNAFYTRLKTFITLHMVPENWNRRISFNFVDQAAQAIRMLMNAQDLHNQVYHIKTTYSMNWKQMAELLTADGIAVKPANLVDLLEMMGRYLEEEKQLELISQALIYSGAFSENREENVTQVQTENQRTISLLEQLGYQWPAANSGHIAKMIRHCREVKYF